MILNNTVRLLCSSGGGQGQFKQGVLATCMEHRKIAVHFRYVDVTNKNLPSLKWHSFLCNIHQVPGIQSQVHTSRGYLSKQMLKVSTAKKEKQRSFKALKTIKYYFLSCLCTFDNYLFLS